MSDPILEEMLRRARRLAETRGCRRHADTHGWEWKFRHSRVECVVRELDDKVMVSFRKTPDRSHPRLWIYFVDLTREEHSLYHPEYYEEAVEIMREMMILDDLANA